MSPVAQCWKRMSFHIYEHLLLSKNLWRCWTQQLFRGNSLHLLAAAACSLLFFGSVGLCQAVWEVKGKLWRAGFWASLSILITSWSFILAPSAQWEVVGLNHVPCNNNCHLNAVYLCTGSCWLSWWGPYRLYQAGKLLWFLFWDCRHQFNSS